jgi:hypothetical protein
MCPNPRNLLTTLATGLIGLSVFGCQPAKKISGPTATNQSSLLFLGHLPIGLKERLEQLAKPRDQVAEAANLRLSKLKRQGCLDEQTEAYHRLPLKVIDPAFRPCAATLSAMTQVPLMLPSSISKISKDPLYAYFDDGPITREKYSIGLTEDIAEYYQRKQASVTGESITVDSPSLAEYYEKESSFVRSSPFESYRLESGPIQLVDGIQGYYISGVCVMNCHSAYSRIIWDQGGYRYRISIKMGRKQEVLQIVNAAIENQAN